FHSSSLLRHPFRHRPGCVLALTCPSLTRGAYSMATNCPVCGVAPEQWHRPGCRLEQCPYCGEHLIDCDCNDGLPPLDDRLTWRGYYFWLEACLEFGYFEKPQHGTWVACASDAQGARPDFLRGVRGCYWNRKKKGFERRTPTAKYPP